MYQNITSVFILIAGLPFTGELQQARAALGNLLMDDNPYGLCAVALSCVGALFISITTFHCARVFSPVTYLTLNNLIKIPAFLLSWIIFDDKMTLTMAFGLFVSFLGGYWYSRDMLRTKEEAVSMPAEQEAHGRTLGTVGPFRVQNMRSRLVLVSCTCLLLGTFMTGGDWISRQNGNVTVRMVVPYEWSATDTAGHTISHFGRMFEAGRTYECREGLSVAIESGFQNSQSGSNEPMESPYKTVTELENIYRNVLEADVLVFAMTDFGSSYERSLSVTERRPSHWRKQITFMALGCESVVHHPHMYAHTIDGPCLLVLSET